MLRQNRTTVGLLTCARSASSLTGRLANARGSPSTKRPTRCSAGASDGNDALMRSSMALTFLAPAVVVARDHRARRARAPRAGGVGPRAGAVAAPVVHDRLD